MRAHALAGHFFGHVHMQAERVAIESQRLVEVLHGDADVVEDGFHGRSDAAIICSTAAIRIQLAGRNALGQSVDLAGGQRRLHTLHEPARQQVAQPHALPLALPHAARRSAECSRNRADLPPELLNTDAAVGLGLHDGRFPLARRIRMQRQVRGNRLGRRDPLPRDRPC